MNLHQKAYNRKQLEDMVSMKKELLRDLNFINNKLNQIKILLAKKKYTKHPQLLDAQAMYLQNKQIIHQTLKVTNELLQQIRLQEKPRAYFQVTKKLI